MSCKKLFVIITAMLTVALTLIIGNSHSFAAAEQDIILDEKLGTFETGLDGWVAGPRTLSVSRVTSFLNGPAIPYHGTYCLEAQHDPAQPANQLKGISRSFSEPRDFSHTPFISMGINTYGHPNATYIGAILRVWSGSEYTQNTVHIQPNSWNLVCLDISGWKNKTNITNMEIYTWAEGVSEGWAGRIQIDNVIASDRVILGTFENGKIEATWNPSSYVSRLDSVSSLSGSEPLTQPKEGSHALEATTDIFPGNVHRLIYVDLGEGVDFTDFPVINSYIDVNGNLGGAFKYYAKLKAYAGSNNQYVYEGATGIDTVLNITGNNWNNLKLDLSGWAYKNNVRRLEFIIYGDSTSQWGPKIHIDSVTACQENLDSSFETGTAQKWMAWNNVSGVDAVTSTLNSPYLPYEGNYCLEISGEASVAGDVPRTVRKDFSSPIGIQKTPVISLRMNYWQGCPGATAYYAKVKVLSNDKYMEQIFTLTQAWQLLSINIADWQYVNEIMGIEVSFYTDSPIPWTSKYQIDDFKISAYDTIIGEFHNKSFDGWLAGTNTDGINVVNSMTNWPGYPVSGEYMLQAYSKGRAANVKKEVYRNFATAQDWTNTTTSTGWVNVSGDAPGGTAAYYWVQYTVWSGANTTNYQKKISPDSWNMIKFDISGWNYKNAVTKISIEVWAEGSSSWNIWDVNYQVDCFSICPSVNTVFPQYSSSDTTRTDNLNEMLFDRWNNNIGPNPLTGDNQTIFREWDSLASAWVDTNSYKLNGLDYNNALRRNLLSIGQDADGYVYMFEDGFFSDIRRVSINELGWPFPTYGNSNGLAKGWEFNEYKDEGWTANGFISSTQDSKHWKLYSHSSGNIFISTPDNLNMPAYHTPYVMIRMANKTSATSANLQFITNTDTNWDTAKQKSFTISNDGEYHTYFIPMYTLGTWSQSTTIKQIRLNFIGVASSDWIGIDYFHCNYDSRHTTANGAFILGSSRYFMWHRDDIAFLSQNISRMRNALYYMRNKLGGDANNYILNNWWGHEGTTGFVTNGDGSKTIYYGKGLGANYWDLIPIGYKDFAGTYYYFAALQAMADIEELIENNPAWGIATAASPYEGSTACRTRAANVRSTILNGTTFWNSTTGRYVPSVDENGIKHDYGFTWLNLEALYYGLGEDTATPGTKAKSILDWITGTRNVAGDTSQGADIYNYLFSPRNSTLRNIDWYVFAWYAPESIPWGQQVQDGGAVMYTSYYDIMARLKYLGADNAWSRMQNILDWYTDVKNDGGYRWYYKKHGIEMQGAGRAGAVGIDSEFTESTIFPTVFFYGFLGINADKDGLVVAPKKPAALDYMRVDNVNYMGGRVSVYTDNTESRIAIDISSGTRNIKFGSLTPGNSYTVYKNGTTFAVLTADSNGYVKFATSGTGNHEYKVIR